MRTSPLHLLLTLLLLTSAVPAAFADASAAKEHFRRGKEAYDLGRFEEALRAYELAYEEDPRPQTLFNIGQCHRHLGNFERAAFSYRRFLDQAQPDPKTRALATDLLAEVEEKAKAQARGELSPPVLTPAPTAEPTNGAEVALTTAATGPEAQAQAKVPLTRRWWFWAGAGAVVLAAGAGAAAMAAQGPDGPSPSLGTADLRR